MKTIMILMDSLNRHYLNAYGNNWVKTPNIDRLAQKSVIFDNHWIGSAPCMPARRDLMTGRLNFLERGWGGLEPFDKAFPNILRQNKIYCHMETDHYHYFHPGGENYHSPFNSWRLYRGQENDAYAYSMKQVPKPENYLGQWTARYEKAKAMFKDDAGYPSPRTFQGATEFVRENKGQGNYFLWVEAFDPHEPFDAPDEFLESYNDDWKGPHYDWSAYDKVDGKSEATKHLQKKYAASLSMNDKWLGKLLDEIEEQNGWEDTMIIFTTDHGHMLGEHDCTGKNRWHVWNEMANIPLMIHLPGSKHAGQRRNQLTQAIDIAPTVLDFFKMKCPQSVMGKNLIPVLENDTTLNRHALLYGWYGQCVNLTDGTHTYFRAPASDANQPLYQYFLQPNTYGANSLAGKDFFIEAQLGQWLPYTKFPVIRSKHGFRVSEDWKDTRLYNIVNDPQQQENLVGGVIEKEYELLLRQTLVEMQAPKEQNERLGL